MDQDRLPASDPREMARHEAEEAAFDAWRERIREDEEERYGWEDEYPPPTPEELAQEEWLERREREVLAEPEPDEDPFVLPAG